MVDRPVFLVGFMGCGKSTIGRVLARRIGYEFLDTDEMIETREGRTVAEIFAEQGEAHFRSVEAEVLRGLDGRRSCVVATGGGLFLSSASRRWLRGRGTTIWLDAALDVCRERVGRGRGRPLWPAGEPWVGRAFFDRRRACYALARHRVMSGRDTDPEAAAARAEHFLRASG